MRATHLWKSGTANWRITSWKINNNDNFIYHANHNFDKITNIILQNYVNQFYYCSDLQRWQSWLNHWLMIPSSRVQILPLLKLAENGRCMLLIGRSQIEKLITMTNWFLLPIIILTKLQKYITRLRKSQFYYCSNLQRWQSWLNHRLMIPSSRVQILLLHKAAENGRWVLLIGRLQIEKINHNDNLISLANHNFDKITKK